MSEKFILTVKEMHLGYVKETFRAGAVIELDEVNKRIIIDGRKFEDTRDLDVLKRQAERDPAHAWIIPYSEEALAIVREARSPKVEAPKKPRPGEGMPIVKSDEDLTESIDIRATQISKRNNEAKEAARNKPKNQKMEIIKGDETVEERLAALKDKTDINSIAERVRLKQSGPKMPIVKDDSLGSGVSSKVSALNAGQPLPSRESVEAKTEEARLLADARKKEVEAKRKTTGVEVPSENAVPQPPALAESQPSAEQAVGIEMGENDTDASKDAEIVALKAKIAELEAQNKKPAAVRRVPVKTAAQAEEVLSTK
jgi:hypothetical protein